MFEIKGDILKDISPDRKTVVLHGCNCFHIMGAGIAAYLRKTYPQVYAADCTTVMGDKNKLGSYSVAQVNENLVVLNCYTQYTIRTNNGAPPVSYRAIRACLEKVNQDYAGWQIRTPKIGCGLAGGDWSIVRQIFAETLPKQEVVLYYL